MDPVYRMTSEWRPLFRAYLHFRDRMGPIVSGESRQGELIGSGDGFLCGQRLHGRLSWTLFEDLSDTLAVIDHALIVHTLDQATVYFDVQGFATRPQSGHPTWAVIGALRFHTDDPRYNWLENTMAVWRGVYDGETRRAHYRAFSCFELGADGAGSVSM